MSWEEQEKAHVQDLVQKEKEKEEKDEEHERGGWVEGGGGENEEEFMKKEKIEARSKKNRKRAQDSVQKE